MTNNKYYPLLLTFGIAILMVLLALFSFDAGTKTTVAHADNAYTSSQFSVASTSSITTAVTTSTLILGTTTATHTRLFADICNPSATVPVVLNLQEGEAADARTNGGIWLNTNSCFDITPLRLYTGSVTASTSNGSSVGMLVTEYEF